MQERAGLDRVLGGSEFIQSFGYTLGGRSTQSPVPMFVAGAVYSPCPFASPILRPTARISKKARQTAFRTDNRRAQTSLVVSSQAWPK